MYHPTIAWCQRLDGEPTLRECSTGVYGDTEVTLDINDVVPDQGPDVRF